MARTVNVGADALGGSFEPAPAGTKVNAVVFEIEESTVKSTESENHGKPQGVVTVKILDDFRFTGSDGKQQNLKNREVRYNNVPFYAGTNAWQLAAFAEAVGWPVDENGEIQIPEQHELAQATQGKELVVQLGIRTSQDGSKKYQTVSRWLPAGSKTSAGADAPAGGASPAGGAGNPWA